VPRIAEFIDAMDHTGSAADELGRVLASLERKGLVSSNGENWIARDATKPVKWDV
jgi:hypothetical protein